MIQVVAAVIFNDKNEIFISRRKHGKPLAGYWEFPGGKIEDGETPEESIKREIFEELNVEMEVESFLGENIHYYKEYSFSVQLLAFTGRIIEGEIILKDHDAMEWVSVDELQQFQFAPADIPFIKTLQNT